MADIAGVEQKLRQSWCVIDPVNRHPQGGHYVGVGRLVEPHVAVADLDEAQLPSGGLSKIGSAEAVGSENPTLHDQEGSSAGPGHAFQESTAVNSVVVVIVPNEFLFL